MTVKNKLGISVFFPCYNDEGSIGLLIDDAIKTLKRITSDFEIIVVDDGSEDNSRNILREYAQKYPLKIVLHEVNKGYGGALRSGFKAATKELIFYTDGDGQYDVKELPILIQLMGQDVNFVNGMKMTRQDASYRIILGNIYSFLARWFFWLPVYDVDCDFRLIRKNLIEKVNLENNSGAICIELVKKAQIAGAKFRQVSVHHYRRQWGQSQFFRINRLFLTFRELVITWYKLMVKSRLQQKQIGSYQPTDV